MNAELDLPARQLRYWDVKQHAYRVEPGTYQLQIGAASDDIRHLETLTVTAN